MNAVSMPIPMPMPSMPINPMMGVNPMMGSMLPMGMSPMMGSMIPTNMTPMTFGTMTAMGGVTPMMLPTGVRPMMLARMSCEMTKDGMCCKLTPIDASGLEMMQECCDAMTSMLAMGAPCCLMVNGMPMVACVSK